MGQIRLYNIDGCGYCAMVRNQLDRMEIEYEKIDVPWPHHLRTDVMDISGQTTVPVLVDDDVVLSDENDIILYLKKTYANS